MAKALILLALAGGSLLAATPRACLNDIAGLAPEVRTALERELVRLLPRIEILPACGTQPLTTAKISILPAFASRPGVLGSALRMEQKVLPVIEVYRDAVLRALGGRTHPTTVGKALARVAAHEAVHFFDQKLCHEGEGLLREAFSGEELASPDRRLFAWRRDSTD